MGTEGDMLRLARQRLGFTQKTAASRLGVVQPVLSRIENGVTEPDEALLFRAAHVYRVPKDFFLLRDPVYGPPVSVHPMLRAKSDVSGRDLDMITAELNIRIFHIRRFLEGVDFEPTADLPSLDVEQYGTPERIAATVRAHWAVPPGPIKNLVQLVERAGVIVGLSKFGGASVSGATFRVPGKPPLILLNAAHPADRIRYTLGHELAHLIMHRFPNGDMENEANEFSSALLMPAADIRSAFRGRRITIELLAALKPEWKVSMQALLKRGASLGFVTPNQARYLWQQISSKGWRLREPAELDFLHESPKVLPSIIKSHLSELGYSMDQLATLVRLHEGEFIEMYGSPSTPAARPRLTVVS
jgi:Zn-dependent peptidase ImmA (M78 family)/DNA-binding XRE family transcriptional regulator